MLALLGIGTTALTTALGGESQDVTGDKDLGEIASGDRGAFFAVDVVDYSAENHVDASCQEGRSHEQSEGLDQVEVEIPLVMGRTGTADVANCFDCCTARLLVTD